MRLVGAKVPRVEDRRILTGHGHYVDDVSLPRMVHASFLRSPIAHARITDIDVSAAREVPGVIAVFTADDLAAVMKSIPFTTAALDIVPEFYSLAKNKVLYVGDPVAMVIAKTRREAEDGAELIEVSYDPLQVVVTPEAALDPDGPLLFEDLESNVMAEDSMSVGDVEGVFANADRVIKRTLQQHRITPAPMETIGGVADYDIGRDELTLHSNAQHPHGLRLSLAEALEMPHERIRIITTDIGGAFGLKGSFVRENFSLAAATRLLNRPVKWTEDRYEHLLSAGHARDDRVDLEIAVSNDGTLLGMRAHLTIDQGAYPKAPFPASRITSSVQPLLPGPYRWEAYAFSRRIVATNKAAYISYRGPWAVETWVRERMLDEVARELEIDTVELRRRNLVDGAPEDVTITGLTLAGVASRQSLECALDVIDYKNFRCIQQEQRKLGRYLGMGLSTFIEAAPGPLGMRPGVSFGGEQAKVKLENDGHLTVTTSQTPQGQGHETTLAQLAADAMGVEFEHVKVVHGDTRSTPFKLIGTGASMAATWANGAVLQATRTLKEKVLALAGELLEASPSDLMIEDGYVMPLGIPAKRLALADVAKKAALASRTLPSGVDPILEVHDLYKGDDITGSGWSGGTHTCLVEIDLETGQVHIRRYVVAEDCGRVVNPGIVEGQVRGGVAQGIGQVLYENAAYDKDGNLLASTFMDYLLPTAVEIPTIEIEHLETNASEFEFRGVGEGGMIAAPGALTNAVADALAPFGARVLEQYLPPAKVLELANVIPKKT